MNETCVSTCRRWTIVYADACGSRTDDAPGPAFLQQSNDSDVVEIPVRRNGHGHGRFERSDRRLERAERSEAADDRTVCEPPAAVFPAAHIVRQVILRQGDD